jgi:hypothetical protein
MIKAKLQNIKIRLVLVFLSVLLSNAAIAQIPGSLFMTPNNFYAQMFNPSYMRNDKAIEISVAGLGGFAFGNQGSFKISELITTPNGNPVVDPVNFYNAIPENNFFRQNLTIPMVYVNVPVKKGALSFYYKENVSSVFKFKNNVIDYLIHGNMEPEYEDYSTDAVNLITAGYREFAFGYAKNVNKKLDVGIHGKLLFGGILVKAEDWDYRVRTSADGKMINFITEGKGRLAVPVPYRLRGDSTILSFDMKGAFSKYVSNYKNPGLAVDLGLTYQISDEDKVSFALRDLGFIWFKDKSMTMSTTGQYDYIGFELINAIRWPEEPGYEDPVRLINLVKDSIRYVWQPKVYEEGFAYGLGPKTSIHYQRELSDFLSLGLTNQSVFQKNNFQNTLTLSALQSWPYLSVFESISWHGSDVISIGAGLQYELKFAQLFLASDNLIAFYHPANNKSFSLTAGICILINNEREQGANNLKGGIKKRSGKFSKHLPYYEKFPPLKRK